MLRTGQRISVRYKKSDSAEVKPYWGDVEQITDTFIKVKLDNHGMGNDEYRTFSRDKIVSLTIEN